MEIFDLLLCPVFCHLLTIFQSNILNQSGSFSRGYSLLVHFLCFLFFLHFADINAAIDFPVRNKDIEERKKHHNIEKVKVTSIELWLTCWSCWWMQSWAARLQRRFPARCWLCSELWRSWLCGRNGAPPCSLQSHCTPPLSERRGKKSSIVKVKHQLNTNVAIKGQYERFKQYFKIKVINSPYQHIGKKKQLFWCYVD